MSRFLIAEKYAIVRFLSDQVSYFTVKSVSVFSRPKYNTEVQVRQNGDQVSEQSTFACKTPNYASAPNKQLDSVQELRSFSLSF